MPFKVPKLRFLPSFGTDIGSTVAGRSKLAESGARSVFSFLPGFIATPPRPFDTVRDEKITISLQSLLPLPSPSRIVEPCRNAST